MLNGTRIGTLVLAVLVSTQAVLADDIKDSVPSRSLLDAKDKIKVVFLDWDGSTIANNDFSEAHRDSCNLANGNNCTDLRKHVKEAYNLTRANVTTALGGPERKARIQDFLRTIRRADTKVYILSTSWEPIPGENWSDYIMMLNRKAKLGFKRNEIIGLDDPGVGISACKGCAIHDKLLELGLKPTEALFMDDSSGNIESNKKEAGADSIYLQERDGYGRMAMEYTEARTSCRFYEG